MGAEEQEERHRGARNERDDAAPNGKEGCLRVVLMKEELLSHQGRAGDSKSKRQSTCLSKLTIRIL